MHIFEYMYKKINKPEILMNIDRAVFALVGLFILVSLALGLLVSPWWFLFTAFVGLNMFQAAFTGFCPLARFLLVVGVKPGCAFEAGKSGT